MLPATRGQVTQQSSTMKRIAMRAGLVGMSLLVAAAVQGCALAAAGAAGAAAGYVANEKGYEVQSPITKKPQHKHAD